MACSSIIYNIEPREDHLLQYMEDSETTNEPDVNSENKDLIIDILETFHRDMGFRNIEFE